MLLELKRHRRTSRQNRAQRAQQAADTRFARIFWVQLGRRGSPVRGIGPTNQGTELFIYIIIGPDPRGLSGRKLTGVKS